MSTQPNQGKNPDQDSYGGYGGYQPRKPADDPYGAYYQPSGGQQGTTTGASNQQDDPNYVYGQSKQQGQSYKASSTSSGQQQQQQYQPPSSVSGRSSSSSSSGQTSTGLKSNQAAALSYVLGCFTGIFFLLWKRNDRKVRFNAAQSVAVFLPLLVIYGVVGFLIGLIGWIPIIGWLIGLLWGLITGLLLIPIGLLWLFLIVQAFFGREIRLPFVGRYAEILADYFAPKQQKTGN